MKWKESTQGMSKKLKEKLRFFIQEQIEEVYRKDSSRFETCDHYNWDKDIWRYRHFIIDFSKERGLRVDTQMNWGVLDVTITKENRNNFEGQIEL